MKTINYDLLKIKNTSTGEFEPLGMALGLTDMAQAELDKKVNKTDIIDVEHGGTGATSATEALNNLGGRTIYTRVEDLGLTAPATIDQVYAAMPSHSTIIVQNSNYTQISDVPIQYSMVIIHKTYAYGYGECTNTNTGAPVFYKCNLYSGRTFDGWKQVVTQNNMETYVNETILGGAW